MLWETFKAEIRKIAKSQNKKAYYRMLMKNTKPKGRKSHNNNAP